MSFVLGLDPGLSEVGFGVLKLEKGKMEFLDCGIFRTLPQTPFPERLHAIKIDLETLLETYPIEAAGVEELFFVKNITNGIKVAHARGVLLESLQSRKITIHEFKPLEVKNNICGYGGADKRQVQEMVKRLLNLNTLPKPHDAADALAVALCAAQVHSRVIQP